MDKWRIYYQGGHYRDLLGKPYGVVCVLQEDDFIGRKILHGYDYYLLIDDDWLGMDRDSFMHYITSELHRIKAVLVGVMVQHHEFERIYKLAKNDPDFPPRTAGRKLESPIRSKGRVD